MKAKKIVALIMSAAMVMGTAALFTACNNDDVKDPGGTVDPNPTPDPNPNPNPNPTPDFIEDTNTYYVVGAGIGTLEGTSWSESDTSITFEKDTTVTDANVFKLTLTMYEDDQFKILHETNWNTAVHYKNFAGDNYSTYFSTNNDNNIICKAGQDAIYEFTLTSDLSKTVYEERWVLTVEQKEKVQLAYDMHVMGDLGDKVMTKKGDGIWAVDIEIKADRHLTRDEAGKVAGDDGVGEIKYAAIYVHNNGVGSDEEEPLDFATTGSIDITFEETSVKANLLEAGKYTITFNENTGTVEIKKLTDEWHIVQGTTTNPSALTYDGTKGIWSGSITLEEETAIKLTNVGEGATDEDIDLGTLSAGYWVIEYNETTKEAKKGLTTYYLVGSYTTPGWGDGLSAGVALQLTETETPGVYSVEVDWTELTDEYVTFKVVKGNPLTAIDSWHGHWQTGQYPDGELHGDNDGDNFKLATGKKYIIYIDDNTYQKITYEEVVEEAPAE